MIKMTDTPSPPPYEETWKQSLNDLQQQMTVYETAQRSGDDHVIEQEAPKVASAMRTVGDNHTDPKVKAVWYKKADKFLRSKGTARHGVLQEVGKVVCAVVTMPCALAGCVLCLAGNIVRGVGSGIIGLGELVASGEKPYSSQRR
jgi:hypothetical protein